MGQEYLVHPRIKRRKHLVGVDQDDLAAGSGSQGPERRILRIEAHDGPQDAHESVGRRIEVARVHVTHRDILLVADVGKLAEQARLTYTAGPEDVQHVKGEFVRGDRGPKKIPFGNPTNKSLVALFAEASRQARRHNHTFPVHLTSLLLL